VFWSYNVPWAVFDLYLAWILAPFFVSTRGPDAAGLGLPLKVWLLFGGMCLIPLPAMVAAVRMDRADRPARLLRLLYGIEVPTQGLLFLALLFLRHASPFVWLFTTGVTIATLGLAFVTLRPSRARALPTGWILLLSQAVGVLLAAYVLVLWIFLLPVAYAALAPDLPGFREPFRHPILWFVVISIANGVLSPFAATAVYFRSFRRQFQSIARQGSRRRATLAVAAAAMTFVALGVSLSWQPSQARLHAAVQRLRQARSFEEQQRAARALEPELSALRRYLAGVYVAPYRYVVERESLPLLLPPGRLGGAWSAGLQRALETLAAPFVYRGRFREDSLWAADAYKDVFDEGIQNGEHETIEASLQASFREDDLSAGLLDRFRTTVKVVSQEVRVDWDGRCASVTITEEYENETFEPQEVLYEFSLPQSSAITGLWLGPRLEFEGTLAPRGAARQVYEAQVARSKDPALLEQTGPRQYRLRVFPIPGRAAAFDDDGRPRPELLKAAFRYVQLPDLENGVPVIRLPRLHEKRNVFWDERLDARSAGPVAPAGASGTHWSAGSALPITAPPSGQTDPTAFRIADAAVALVPAGGDASSFAADPVGASRQVAVLLDASHGGNDSDWLDVLRKDAGFATLVGAHRVDAYFFNDLLGPAVTIDRSDDERLAGVHFLGKAQILEALQPLCDSSYDSILVLARGGGFHEAEAIDTSCEGPPLAIVHVDGRIPPYSDALTARVLRGCGIQDTIASAMRCLAAPPSADVKRTMSLTTTASLEISPDAARDRFEPCPADRALCQLLARELALAKLAAAAPSVAMPELHELATGYHVLTPTSSLIALVNDGQRQELEDAAMKEGAFAPAGVGTEEQLEAPSGQGLLNVQGVPEPETWALLSVATIVLGSFLWKWRAA
jgi:putative PEP-CTERM system integral membrane protein